MKNTLNLGEMYRAVMESDEMRDEYYKRLNDEKITYSKKGHKVRGKKVGIQKLILNQRYIAAAVYRDFHSK